MRLDILRELASFISSNNFIYDTFAIKDGKDVYSFQISENASNVDKGCLAFYTVTKYQSAIPSYTSLEDVFDAAAKILELDSITADFLFSHGNNINFNFNCLAYSSDAAECKAKIAFILNKHG
jgi:hypothetical protein